MNGKVMDSAVEKGAGIVLILTSGIIHLIDGPENYGEMAYIGVLFFVATAASLVAAWGIANDRRWGWTLGAAVAGATLVGYLLSRTVGIPGKHEASLEAFLEPMGVLSVIVEVAFLIVATRVVGRTSLLPTGGSGVRA